MLPAYLIVGGDELKRRRVLEKLRQRVEALGDLSFNHDEFDGETTTGTAIASACNTLPFASEMRLVEVKNGEKLKKADNDVLEAYLAAPSQSTVLAFSAEKLAKNTRLYKAFAALGSQAVITCEPMKRFELVRAVRSMAAGYGFTLSESAASKLIELTGEDTVRLDSELRKLALAANPDGTIGERDVATLVARTTVAKPWELTDALSRRDLKQCLVLLGLCEDAPLRLLALCVARLRELACAQALEARGEGANLAKELGLQPWRVKNLTAWARNFTPEELRRAFSSARDCEQKLKSTSLGDAAFRDWVISTVS